MVPGLSHMVTLGHIISMLQDDPELTIVLDSPSSGHAMTMFESSLNFKEIFQSGIIVDDISKMQKFITSPETMSVKVCALPHILAINEAREFQDYLKTLNIVSSDIVLNCSLKDIPNLETAEDQLPSFLKSKISQEEETLNHLEEKIDAVVPFISTVSREEKLQKLIEQVGVLI